MKPIERTNVARDGWLYVSVGVAVVAMGVVGLVAWRLEASGSDRVGAARDPNAVGTLPASTALAFEGRAAGLGEQSAAENGTAPSAEGEDEAAIERLRDSGSDAGAEEAATPGRAAFTPTAEEVAFIPGEAPARARDTGLVFSAPADPAFNPTLHKPEPEAPERQAPVVTSGDAPAPAEQPEIAPGTHGTVREPVEFVEPPPVRRKDLDTGLVFTAPGDETGTK